MMMTMMSRSSFVLLAVLASCLLAAAATGSGRVFVEHTEPLRLPEGWIKGERLAAEEIVELLIAVRLTNTAELERRYELAFLTPSHDVINVSSSPSIFVIFILFRVDWLLRICFGCDLDRFSCPSR
jgi:hypothetical protein